MRKYQKEQAENFIQLLTEAHEEIRINIEKKNYEPVLVMLVDCQDGAIALGNLIEVSEGEGCVTIPLLEKYCELVFQIYTDISNGGYVDAIKTDKSLCKALTQIENSVSNDIKVRKEIAFFPYNASMWDSLESVYLAAKEDPDCDTYCVPIPFFEKNADGTIGQMHYEGTEYPASIEITDWQTYNFEERRPDVMYIHNPYDASNHVTCVHPRFFSSNLKKYTDELVYIPYFVGPEIDPKDQAAIEQMKHFCFMPGVMHADKVILQSENHRQVYIAEYAKAAKQYGLEGKHIDRDYLEGKFLALGSPKFDKVMRTKKEDVVIPDEWLNVIKKPDGSYKKIIFYNTSIQAMLVHKEQMLRKIKHVLETLKENRDEVTLLWRPHPLLESTIKSMLPQLWEEYDALTKQYREEGWGIWDDTKDMNRAVVLSDAYYGDPSSVVQVYHKTGKPVMVQNVEVLRDNRFSNLFFSGRTATFDNENDVLWLVTNYTSTLLKIDLKSGNVLSSYQIPLKQVKEYDFVEMKKIGQNLFLLPHNTEKFYSFSISKEEFMIIDIQLNLQEEAMPRKFKRMLYNDGFLYFIGFSLDLVVKINLLDYHVKLIRNLANNGKTLAWDATIVGNDLYIPLAEENTIIKLNVINDSIQRITVDKEESEKSKGFITITALEQSLLLTDAMNNRILYQLEAGKSELNKLDIMAKRFEKYDDYNYYKKYHKVICYQGKEFYFPAFDEVVMVRDSNKSCTILQYNYPSNESFKDIYSKYELIEQYGRFIFFQARTSGEIYRINLETNEICLFELQMSSYSRSMHIKYAILHTEKDIVYENDVIILDEYVGALL